MSNTRKAVFSFSIMFLLLLAVGFGQSWNVMLAIFNLCLISAVMSLGLNIQWGYAGLFNAGVMASTAVGGLAAVLVSYSPVAKAWNAGGTEIGMAFLFLVGTVLGAILIWKWIKPGRLRTVALTLFLVLGYALMSFYYEAVSYTHLKLPTTT